MNDQPKKPTSIWMTWEVSPSALSTAAVPQRSPRPTELAAGAAGGGHVEEDAAG